MGWFCVCVCEREREREREREHMRERESEGTLSSASRVGGWGMILTTEEARG